VKPAPGDAVRAFSNCITTTSQADTNSSTSADEWALDKNTLANRAPATSLSLGSVETEAIISRVTLPARDIRSSETPQR
jgi:hypothetical protein